MTAIVCIDNRNGVSFNGKRQTADLAVFADIMALAESSCRGVRMSQYSLPTFSKYAELLRKSGSYVRDFTAWANAPTGYYFAEVDSLKDQEQVYDEVVVYCWNTVYPYDKALQLDLSQYCLIEEITIKGSSHSEIIRRTYRK